MVDLLLEEIIKILPEGPKYFPDDIITDQPERLLQLKLLEKISTFLEEIPLE